MAVSKVIGKGGSFSGGILDKAANAATGGSKPNMSRNQSLAGQSVKDGDHTTTYDENGYASGTVRDGGASATSTKKTTHANDSVNHQEAYKAAQAGNWDRVGYYTNLIAQAGGKDEYGNYDMAAANQYMKELQDEFRYNAQDYYDKRYDQAYGTGSSDVFDATGGAIKTYDDLVAVLGQQGAQQVLGGLNGGFSGGRLPGGAFQGMGSAEDYLRELYQQKIAAELADLRSTYEQNVADIQSQDDLIAQLFNQQRNQAAGQNELGRMQMNEYAIMQGLNTGTAGQMALSQNTALQGNLAALGGQEAQSLAENALNLQKLTAAYRSAKNQTSAEGNAKLADALYNELVRQQEMAMRAQQAAQEQANWEAKFNYQQQMDQRDYDLALDKLYQKNLGPAGGPKSPSPYRGYNNGGLTSEQVRRLQEYYGVEQDGMWGSDSEKAADGLSADAAWEAYAKLYGGKGAGAQELYATLSRASSLGMTKGAMASMIQSYLDSGKITPEEADQIAAPFIV